MAYHVIKRVKNRLYLYAQEGWRDGNRVRTRSTYIGAIDSATGEINPTPKSNLAALQALGHETRDQVSVLVSEGLPLEASSLAVKTEIIKTSPQPLAARTQEHPCVEKSNTANSTTPVASNKQPNLNTPDSDKPAKSLSQQKVRDNGLSLSLNFRKLKASVPRMQADFEKHKQYAMAETFRR